nr:hypothetical protein [Phormidium tenue]
MDSTQVSTASTSNELSKNAVAETSKSPSVLSTQCSSDCVEKDTLPLSKVMLLPEAGTANTTVLLTPGIQLLTSLTISSPDSKTGNHRPLTEEEEEAIFCEALAASFLIKRIAYPLCQVMGMDEVEHLRWRIVQDRKKMLAEYGYSKREILFWDFVDLVDICLRWVKSIVLPGG